MRSCREGAFHEKIAIIKKKKKELQRPLKTCGMPESFCIIMFNIEHADVKAIIFIIRSKSFKIEILFYHKSSLF